MLLLDANMTVPRDRIVDALWDDPPTSAVANIQTHVSGLRRVLAGTAPGHAARLETRGNGYCLAVDRDQLDLLVFADLACRGRRHLGQGDILAAEREFGRAVALWRGRPLGDVALSALAAPRLTEIEERFEQVWTDWIDVRLSRGEHDRLVGELRMAAETRPLRERVWERLIVALYRARRRGEALDAYRRARAILIEELGVEPSVELQRLHTAVLNGDPSLDRLPQENAAPVELHHGGPDSPDRARAAESRPNPPAGRPGSSPGESVSAAGDSGVPGAAAFGAVRPAELPHDVPGFAGRSREQATLSSSLPAGDAATAPTRPSIWVISGTAGVGKTAMAVHWAHATADAFPDAQLYVDLHGFDPRRDPVEPAMALAQLLRSLGVPPTQVPEGLDGREKLYRSVLRGRRVLLLLDDARTAGQIRPLLPGHGEAVVLVTSRFRLSDLIVRDGAGSLPLSVLTPADTRELLAHVLSEERLTAEPAAAEELARLCGHLPLALRMAAANITGRPDGTIASMVAELGNGDRFTELSVDGDSEGAVGMAFRQSYQLLRPEQQRMFRLLSLIPGPTFTPPVVAVLLGCSRAAAGGGLKALAAAHLIECQGAHRYRFHDLLRLYATDRAVTDEPGQDRQQALVRLLAYYLHGADAAGATINSSAFPLPGELPLRALSASRDLSDTSAELEWLHTELENIIPAVAHCLANGPLPFAWRILDALRPFLNMGAYREEWLELGRLGLDAAERSGDRQAQAAMHITLGVARLVLGKLDQGARHLEYALDASTECGWLDGVAEASTHLSGVYQRIGRPREAIAMVRLAIDLHQEHGRPGGQAAAYAILGSSHRWFGDLTQALWHQQRALFLYQGEGGAFGQAICLTELAGIRHELGERTSAGRLYTEALAICERIGARARHVQALAGLSRVHVETGDHEQALRNAELAVTLARRATDRRVEAEALDALARACFALGRRVDAHQHHEKALEIALHVGVAWDIAFILIGMSERQAHARDRERSRASGHRALEIAREHRFRLFEGKAAEALAKTATTDDSLSLYEVALEAYRETSHQPGISRIERMLRSSSSDRGRR
jgi:DNA-binding SARP family transcriptional activator